MRACSAYHTLSAEAAFVVSVVLPLELLMKERYDRRAGVSRAVAVENKFNRWQLRWQEAPVARWTYRLIPNVDGCVNHPFGKVDSVFAPSVKWTLLSFSGVTCVYPFPRSPKDEHQRR